MINLIRCDDRLIHGQCMTRLVQHYKINHIFVIDEFTATNPNMKYVIEKIAMPGMKNEALTIDEAIKPIQAAIHDSVGTMIVFRFPKIATELFSRIPELPKKLMIGPVQKRENTRTVMNGTYLSCDEIEALSVLAQNGIEIFFQVVPGMKRIEFSELK